MTYDRALEVAANVLRTYAAEGPAEGGIYAYPTLIDAASELDALAEYVQEARLDDDD